MQRLCQVVDAVSYRVAQLAFGAMLVVVGVGAFNTLARSADRSLGTSLSSNAYLELQWYLFAGLFLLGGAYTLRRDAHVRVDVLYDRLGKRGRAWIDLVGHGLFLIPFCAFMVVISIDPVLDSWRRREMSPDPSGLPRYPIKAVIPLAFVLLGAQGLSELLQRATFLFGGGAPPEADREPPPEPPPGPPEAADPTDAPAREQVVVVVRERGDG